MQNWEHVQEVLGVVNEKPQELSGIDISRLRPAFADGKARVFRQTVVTSAGQSLDAESVFNKATSSEQPRSATGSSTLARKLKFGGKGKWAEADSDEDEEEDIEPASSIAGVGRVDTVSSLVNSRGVVR